MTDGAQVHFALGGECELGVPGSEIHLSEVETLDRSPL